MGEILALLVGGVLMTKPVIVNEKMFMLSGFYAPNTIVCSGKPNLVDSHYIDVTCAAVRPGTNNVFYYTLKLLKDQA